MLFHCLLVGLAYFKLQKENIILFQAKVLLIPHFFPFIPGRIAWEHWAEMR